MIIKESYLVEVLEHNKQYKVRVISMNEGHITTFLKPFSSVKKALKYYQKNYNTNDCFLRFNDFKIMVYQVSSSEFTKGFTK